MLSTKLRLIKLMVNDSSLWRKKNWLIRSWYKGTPAHIKAISRILNTRLSDEEKITRIRREVSRALLVEVANRHSTTAVFYRLMHFDEETFLNEALVRQFILIAKQVPAWGHVFIEAAKVHYDSGFIQLMMRAGYTIEVSGTYRLEYEIDCAAVDPENEAKRVQAFTSVMTSLSAEETLPSALKVNALVRLATNPRYAALFGAACWQRALKVNIINVAALGHAEALTHLLALASSCLDIEDLKCKAFYAAANAGQLTTMKVLAAAGANFYKDAMPWKTLITSLIHPDSPIEKSAALNCAKYLLELGMPFIKSRQNYEAKLYRCHPDLAKELEDHAGSIMVNRMVQARIIDEYGARLSSQLLKLENILQTYTCERFLRSVNQSLQNLKDLREENPIEHERVIHSNTTYQRLIYIFPDWEDKKTNYSLLSRSYIEAKTSIAPLGTLALTDLGLRKLSHSSNTSAYEP